MAEKKKWMQKAGQRMEKKGTEGAFTAYCKRHGFPGPTQACIDYAMAHGDRTTQLRAGFAKTAKKIARKRKR